MAALSGEGLEWHFIGRIQSNKTRKLAAHFDWVHSIDRYPVAARLSEQRPSNLGPLNVCIQVNIDAEGTRAGALPADLPELAQRIAVLPSLQLRGLMAIPLRYPTLDQQRRVFCKVRQLMEGLNTTHGLALDTLSMGMSADMEAAIAEGATLVRIGADLFGSRV